MRFLIPLTHRSTILPFWIVVNKSLVIKDILCDCQHDLCDSAGVLAQARESR